MATDIIVYADLASYPGLSLPGEEGDYALLLELVNGLINDIIGDLALDPMPTWVKALALKVSARSLTNPEGYTSVTKALDDWKKTTRYEGDATEAGIYLTAAEEAKLLGLLGGGRVQSIRMRVPGYDNCR